MKIRLFLFCLVCFQLVYSIYGSDISTPRSRAITLHNNHHATPKTCLLHGPQIFRSYTERPGSFSFSRPAECCHSLIRLVRTSTPANGNRRAGAQEHPLSADEGHHAFSSQPIAARLLMGRKKSRSALKMMFAPGILLAFYCQLSLGSCLHGTRLS